MYINQIKDFYSFYTEDKIKAFNKRLFTFKHDFYLTDYYRSYLNIIKKCARLCYELNVTNPNKVSVLFEYLLWNGYFSKDKSLLYSLERNNIVGFSAADIMLGKAACMNFSSMQVSLFNELGIEAYVMGTFIDTKLSSKIYKPSVIKRRDHNNSNLCMRKTKESSFLPNNERANHAFVIYKYKEGFVYSDVTNLIFLNNVEPLKAHFIDDSYSVIIKPYVFLLENIVTYESFVELFNDIFKSVKTACIDLDEMIEFTEEVMNLCKDSCNLFDDFYDDIHGDILGVCKILKN